MKRKLVVLLTTITMLLAMIPMTVNAAGTEDGLSLENAVSVTSFTELQSAMGNSAVNFIETTAAIPFGNNLIVPTGKTLIVQPVPDTGYGLTLSDYNLVIQAGGTLINNGGIVCTFDSSIAVDGILQNNAKMDAVRISINGTGSLINASGASIADSSVILLYSGSITNSGSIGCVVHKIGTDAECTVAGVNPAMIRQTNAPISYADMLYTPISLQYSDTATVGLVGDTSVLADAPDTWLMFAKGYSVDLVAGQTIVIQTSTDFRSYLYLTDALTENVNESVKAVGSEGIYYTAANTQTYYIFIGGYDTFDNGTLSLTVYDPADNTAGSLDFTNPSTPATGDGWSWDAVSQTLTLSGIVLSYTDGDSLILPDGSTIVLAAGTENLIFSESRSAISCAGNLSISGSGNLTINAYYSGIECSGALAINASGKISLDASYGITCGSLSLNNCSNLSVYGNYYGIYSNNKITINNCYIYVYGETFGIYTGPSYFYEGPSEGPIMGGDITISNSHIDANCNALSLAAIFAGDNVTESNSGEHSKIILNGCGILSPAEGYVIDTDFPKGGQEPNCQTITSIAGLTAVTAWDQTDKNVVIEPDCNVTYDANSGAGSLIDSNNPYLRTQTVTVLSNSFSRTGYSFTGWNTASDGSGTNYAPTGTFAISKDTTLFAIWKINSFAVTFVDWSGAVLSSQVVNYGGNALAPASPARTGYIFSGWSTAFTNITSDLTVTAQYSAAPTASPTAAPTAVPTTGVAGASKSVVAAAAKTGEQGGLEVMAFVMAISAAGVLAASIALRRRTHQ